MNATALARSQEKVGVPSQFDDVASNYDLLVGINPGYHAHLRTSARRLELAPDARVLDLCCGTGASTKALRRVYPNAEITGLDASAGMLVSARKKKALREVEFIHGNAMDPRASGVKGHFDGILMAYGIRNMPDPDACLGRVLDLLEPGGRICFHEYSVADSFLAKLVWNVVTLGVIIPAGFITSPRSGIYRYLRRSVLEFDGVKAFEERLRRHGFVNVRTQKVLGWQRGIVHSFLAERPR